MSPRFQVFLSAVTSECGEARQLVASDLRSRGLQVKVQEDFRQEPAEKATTLKKLHDYVKGCDRVVAIMGARSGSFPPPDAAAPFKDMLPHGFDRASMTQWEVHFAREFDRRMSIYVASDKFTPAVPAAPNADDDPVLQAQLRNYLFEHKGLDRSAFNSPEDLSRLVLKERWPDYSRPPPKSDRFVSIGALFKGRDDAMERLRESLEQGGRTAVTARAQALHGMGGLGKTRLAIEYGLAHEKDYSALLFLSGETPAALEASLQALAGVLRIADHEPLTEAARRDVVLDWLRENPGWFLVIDNVDSLDAMRTAEGLLAHMSRGAAVITSRLANFPGYFVPLELDVLSVEASVEFLKARTEGRRRPAPADEADAVAIATDLGRLALALEHAGAYIGVKRKSFADYREDWARQRGRVLGWHNAAVTGYPRSVADALLLSIRQVSAAGRALLEHLAFLAPEPVPESLLAAPIPGFVGDAVAVLEEIDGYSLIKRQADAAFTMHRLVQDVVRRELTVEEDNARCIAALNWLIEANDEKRHALAERRRAALGLVLHSEAAGARAGSLNARQAAAHLLDEIANTLYEIGFLSTALRLREQALEHVDQLARANRRDLNAQLALSETLKSVGDIQFDLGEFDAALKNFDAAIAVCKTLTKKAPRNTRWQYDLGICHERIGMVHMALGDLDAALESFKMKREIASQNVKSHPYNPHFRRDLGVAYNKVGDVLYKQYKFSAAMKSYREAAEISSRLASLDRANADWQQGLATSFTKIGDAYFAQENWPEALNSYDRTLVTREKWAKADPLNAGRQRDLAVAYERVGDTQLWLKNQEKAKLAYQGAVDTYEKLIARNPEDTKSRLYSVVARWRLASFDRSNSADHLRAALAILEPLAAANRLDAQRAAWVPLLQAQLDELEKTGRAFSWGEVKSPLTI